MEQERPRRGDGTTGARKLYGTGRVRAAIHPCEPSNGAPQRPPISFSRPKVQRRTNHSSPLVKQGTHQDSAARQKNQRFGLASAMKVHSYNGVEEGWSEKTRPAVPLSNRVPLPMALRSNESSRPREPSKMRARPTAIFAHRNTHMRRTNSSLVVESAPVSSTSVVYSQRKRRLRTTSLNVEGRLGMVDKVPSATSFETSGADTRFGAVKINVSWLRWRAIRNRSKVLATKVRQHWRTYVTRSVLERGASPVRWATSILSSYNIPVSYSTDGLKPKFPARLPQRAGRVIYVVAATYILVVQYFLLLHFVKFDADMRNAWLWESGIGMLVHAIILEPVRSLFTALLLSLLRRTVIRRLQQHRESRRERVSAAPCVRSSATLLDVPGP